MTALSVSGLAAGYGPLQVLRDVSIEVGDGEIVVVLGANGAGKTTALRAISGTIAHAGAIRLAGQDVSRLSAARRARLGLAHVPQGRGTFVEFSVRENLELGAYAVSSASQIEGDISYWFDVFPRLGERAGQIAGSLSGGEQQMLALARAMMNRPKIVMCDEPSLGLAPAVTQELFATFARLRDERGLALLIVEQNAHLALGVADRGYVMEHGSIAFGASAVDLREQPAIQRAYLGH